MGVPRPALSSTNPHLPPHLREVCALLARGLLGVDGEGYGTLQLTADSAEVLSGAREVRFRREAPKAARTRTRSAGKGQAKAAVDLDDTAAAVFERLRAWRAATAKESGVPAYVVFHDATLRDIAVLRPTTTDELGTVSGVGAAKLESLLPASSVATIHTPGARRRRCTPTNTLL